MLWTIFAVPHPAVRCEPSRNPEVRMNMKPFTRTGEPVNDNIYDFAAYQQLARLGSQLRNRRILLAGTDQADTALMERAFRRHNHVNHVNDRDGLADALDNSGYEIVLVSDAIDDDSAVETIKSERYATDDDILFVRVVTDRYASSDPRIPELMSPLTSESVAELITWSLPADSGPAGERPKQPG